MHDTQVKKANWRTSRVQLQKENDLKMKRNVYCPICACVSISVYSQSRMPTRLNHHLPPTQEEETRGRKETCLLQAVWGDEFCLPKIVNWARPWKLGDEEISLKSGHNETSTSHQCPLPKFAFNHHILKLTLDTCIHKPTSTELHLHAIWIQLPQLHGHIYPALENVVLFIQT